MRIAPLACGVVFALGLAIAAPASARADAVEYYGPHALTPELGHGMCFIEGPHLHSYAPHDVEILYVERDEGYVFVGDPTVFEPEHAPRHAYYGHHPVHWHRHGPKQRVAPYCFISGPHHHWHAPSAGVAFETKGGVHWYVGTHPTSYRQQLRQHGYVDEYYASVSFGRPPVLVTPPVGYVGFFVLGAWRPAGALWYQRGGKGGPPPWAPAWGKRGKGHWRTSRGGKLRFDPRRGGGKVKIKAKGGHGGEMKLKAKGGKMKVKGRGGRGRR